MHKTRDNPVSEGMCSLNSLKASMLRCIGSGLFFQHLQHKASQFYGRKMIGYRLNNAQKIAETYRWISSCACFKPDRQSSPHLQPIDGLIFEKNDSTSTYIQSGSTIQLKKAEAVFIQAIRYHHLVIDYKGRMLARSHLTKREGEILRQIQKCLSNAEIARELSISVRTVEKHCQNMFEKLEVENRNALIHLIATHEM